MRKLIYANRNQTSDCFWSCKGLIRKASKDTSGKMEVDYILLGWGSHTQAYAFIKTDKTKHLTSAESCPTPHSFHFLPQSFSKALGSDLELASISRRYGWPGVLRATLASAGWELACQCIPLHCTDTPAMHFLSSSKGPSGGSTSCPYSGQLS